VANTVITLDDAGNLTRLPPFERIRGYFRDRKSALGPQEASLREASGNSSRWR
jgi:hypothetical protein